MDGGLRAVIALRGREGAVVASTLHQSSRKWIVRGPTLIIFVSRLFDAQVRHRACEVCEHTTAHGFGTAPSTAVPPAPQRSWSPKAAMLKRTMQNVRSQLLARLRASEDQAAFLMNAGKLLLRANQLIADELDVEATRAARAARTDAAERRSFMSSLSHGLRTPLHNIYGYAQLLDAGIRGPLTSDQHDDVRRIQDNERHLLNLVNAVIDFARWEDGDPPALEDVLVRDAVEQAESRVSALTKNAEAATIRHTIAHDLIVRADPQRLGVILVQLFENAAKFSRGRPSIHVRALVVGKRVWIRVEDAGIGIANDDLALIFQPFVRSRDAFVREQAGVGLGLAITRKLARAMNGELSVASRPGKGSTFTIALPRGRERSGQASSATQTPPKRGPRTVASRRAQGRSAD